MSRRLSRSKLVVLFIAALVAGILLRLWLLPPTIALTGIESNLIGGWDVVNQSDQSTQLWQFDRQRSVVVCETVAGELVSKAWSGRWEIRDNTLRVTQIEFLNAGEKGDTAEFALKFADTPDELSWVNGDGVKFRAAKSR